MKINKPLRLVLITDSKPTKRIKAILEKEYIKLNSYRYRINAVKSTEGKHIYQLLPDSISYGRRNCFTPIISIELSEEGDKTEILIKQKLYLAVKIILLVQCIVVLILWLLMTIYLVYYRYTFSLDLLKPFGFVSIIPISMLVICAFTFKSVQKALLKKLDVCKDKKTHKV